MATIKMGGIAEISSSAGPLPEYIPVTERTPEEVAQRIVDMVALDELGAEVRLVRKIAAAIREETARCAAIADVYARTEPTGGVHSRMMATVMSETGRKIAAAIRGG